ncbi:brevican core protein [Syngnathoides biaculeatus]|uniref:brevican core protein n=1 Tax=Syngnathoides biaculeatus TaxID=300417 RepID=UPI002ADE3112|nr:brevican core protein [Syngnathoides biaculeatus]
MFLLNAQGVRDDVNLKVGWGQGLVPPPPPQWVSSLSFISSLLGLLDGHREPLRTGAAPHQDEEVLLRSMLVAIVVLVPPSSLTHQHQPDDAGVLNVTITSGPSASGELGASLTLPCLVSLARPPLSPTTNGRRAALSLLRIRWSLIGGEETEILVVRGDAVHVSEPYRGRASLPHYGVSPADLTLRLEGLSYSDAGKYRCHVQQGPDHDYDITQVQVHGMVFHLGESSRGPHDFTFERAREACVKNGAQMATPEQLVAAYHSGYEHCRAGWLSDRSIRYVVQNPREDCLGLMEGHPGVRNLGTLEPQNSVDVYCYVGRVTGEVFFGSQSAPRGFTFEEAEAYCSSEGAELAGPGQLYVLQNHHCRPGWLKDGSVRRLVAFPKGRCEDVPGNQTDFPETTSRHDVYCFRGDFSTPSPPFPVTAESEHVSHLVSTDETATSSESVQTVHPVTQNPLKTEPKTSHEPQSESESHPASPVSLEIFTEATSRPVKLTSPSEEHRNTSETESGTGKVDLTSSPTEEAGSSTTVLPALNKNNPLEEHPESGEIILKIDSLVTPETNAITSSEPSLDSSGELSGVVSMTPATPEIKTVDVDRAPSPGTLSGILSTPFPEVITSIPDSTDLVRHLAAVHSTADEERDKTRSETSDKASGESLEVNPESVSNQTDSPDHHTKSGTPLPSQTTSSTQQVSGFHTEANARLPVEWDEATSTTSTTSTTSGPEGGHEETVTDEVSVQRCSMCQFEDQTMKSVTHPRVDPVEPTATAARPEAILDLCGAEPCSNGGTCVEGEPPKCLCLPGYGGPFCQSDVEVCEAGWVKFQSFCYHHVTARQSWEGAEQHCRTLGGHLMSIMSPEEQLHVNEKYREYQWIGLNDKTIEGDFRWSDGNLLIYENWHQGQPDSYFLSGEDCAATVWHDGGRWSDVPCNYHLPFICKKGLSSCGEPPAVPNAKPFGEMRARYEILAKVRYRCDAGFVQKLNPVISCMPGGRWEEPVVMCLPAGSHEAPGRLGSTAEVHRDVEAITVAHTQSSSTLPAH